jgi:hypothetical protein
MKKLLFIVSTFMVVCLAAKAQNGCGLSNPADSAKYAQVWQWSIGELKEAAKTSYFNVLDMMNDKTTPFDKEKFEKVLNQYNYWRTVVGLKLSNKKDKDAFYNWIVAEARAAGKLTYKEDKKS